MFKYRWPSGLKQGLILIISFGFAHEVVKANLDTSAFRVHFQELTYCVSDRISASVKAISWSP